MLHFIREMPEDLWLRWQRKVKADVVFMDPPRAGSDERFLSSVVKLSPKKVIYISCNPETLAKRFEIFDKASL